MKGPSAKHNIFLTKQYITAVWSPYYKFSLFIVFNWENEIHTEYNAQVNNAFQRIPYLVVYYWSLE